LSFQSWPKEQKRGFRLARKKIHFRICNSHGIMDLHPPCGVEPDMETLIQDLRYSVRQLIKNPGFTLTAVISLALGIGATTAVFSVIYAALMDLFNGGVALATALLFGLDAPTCAHAPCGSFEPCLAGNQILTLDEAAGELPCPDVRKDDIAR
jgi:hypothetical protein